MPQRWLLLIAFELLVILGLAVQVVGTSSRHAPDSDRWGAAGPSSTAPLPAAASAAGRSEPASPLASSPPARTAVGTKWIAADPVGILLRGTLTSRDGSAVQQPGIYLSAEAGVGGSASVGDDGHWALAGLRPGEWTVTVRADAFASLTTQHTLTDEAVQYLELVLDPSFPVRVRIETPDGKDAKVEAMKLGMHFGFHVVGSKDPIPDRLATTNYGSVFYGDAKWQRAERPKDGIAGTLFLAAAPPAHAAVLMRHVVLAQQRIDPGQQEVKFVVDLAAAEAQMATVRLRVLDADSGAPLTDATCGLRSGSGGAHAKADAEGRMRIARALPGLLIVELQAKDHERVTTTIRVGAGELRDLGDLRLGKVLRLQGRVVDAEGRPAPALVQWTALKWRTEPREFADHGSMACDAEGNFEVYGAGAGRHAITARAPDGRIAVGVFDNPPAAPVELRLAAPAQAVFRRPADPGQAFTVTVFDLHQQPVAAWRMEPRVRRFAAKLPPGEYTYEVHDDADRLARTGQLSLGSRPVTIDL